MRHEIDVVSSVSNGEEGLKAIDAHDPDIVLLDLRMPNISGIEVLKNIKKIKKAMPVVMLTTSDDEKDLIEALRNGAGGYLLKDMEPDDLVVALKDVLKGETIVAPNLVQILAKFHQGDDTEINISNLISTLTPRENEILELLADGQSNKLIAKNLGISDGTVKLHVKSILRKLEIHSRVEAAVIAVEHGLRKKN